MDKKKQDWYDQYIGYGFIAWHSVHNTEADHQKKDTPKIEQVYFRKKLRDKRRIQSEPRKPGALNGMLCNEHINNS